MKNWKAILGVLAVFGLGTLTGALVMHRVDQRRLHAFLHGGPGATELIVRRMNRQLELTPDQRAQVATIIRDAHQKLRAARQPIDPQLRGVFEEMDQSIRAVLTPDQQVKFDKLVAERKAKWQMFRPSAAAAEPTTAKPSAATP